VPSRKGGSGRPNRSPRAPSVRVDGRDVEPVAEDRSDFVLACRVYRKEHGVASQPDEDWIRAALVKAARLRER
jgi:hypothetical protein